MVFFIIFAFGFLSGCHAPLFLSNQTEQEPPQTAASRGEVSRREKVTSLDEKTEVLPLRRLKAVPLDPNPLEDPFIFKTTDLGSTFSRGGKVVFTIPSNELNSVIKNKISFVEGMKEHSLAAESEQMDFTMRPEDISFAERGPVSFSGQLEEISFRNPEGVYFTEPLESSFLEREDGVFFADQPEEQSFKKIGGDIFFIEQLKERAFLEREDGVFFADQPEEQSFKKTGGDVFFIEQLEERLFFSEDESFVLRSALQTVFFDTNSFTLSEDNRNILDENIEILKAYPHIDRIALEGHCDFLGSERYNRELGLKRAESVQEYLQSQGIPEERLVLVSYGETQPLFDREIETDLNRRVSFVPCEKASEISRDSESKVDPCQLQ